jgi:hypothetical protein
MRSLSLISGLVLAAYLSSPAGAEVKYQYITDQTTYSGAPGSNVSVNLFVLETITSPSASQIQAHNGLIGAGAAIDVLNPFSGEAQVVDQSFSFAPAFGGGDLADYNQGSSTAANNLEVSAAIAPAQPHVFPAGGLILLGTIDITVGTAPTNFRVTSLFNDTINNSNSALGQSNFNTVAQDGTDFDVTQSGVYTGANDVPEFDFTVAVPEPSAGAIFAALGLLARRRPQSRLIKDCND